jgi:tRNA A37 threonylcarbamoyladenosine synthetase subunit TsaC/SUA5/YrdC
MTEAREAATGSIRDPESCSRGADLLREGSVVGSYVRGVCGIWLDGDNREAIEAAYRIKGEQRGHRPFGVILDAAGLIERIDVDKIARSTSSLFFDEGELAARLGSMCFIRYPIREEVAASLHESLVSSSAGVPWLQSWIPEGCSATATWMRELQAHGLRLPVASSMNVSGTPEIVEQEEGIWFCRDHGIPLFLGDRECRPAARGSFPILQVDWTGIRVVREGHFPSVMFEWLLDGWMVDRTGAASGKYPLIATHTEASARQMPPHRLRLEMIERLDGVPSS